MKLILLIILIVLALPLPAYAPTGHYANFYQFRLEETQGGSVLTDIEYERWVEEWKKN